MSSPTKRRAATGKILVHFKIVSAQPEPGTSAPPDGTYIVDPDKTRLLEKGVTHSATPVGLRGFMGIPEVVPGLSKDLPSRTTEDSDAAAYKLQDLVVSTLHPAAATLGLSLTCLIHGARGVGKRTAVTRVSVALGVHVKEINCFDLAEDSEQATENALRDAIEEASDYTPCIVLLTHVEALSKVDKGEEVAGKQPHIVNVLNDLFHSLATTIKETGHPLMVVATCADVEKLSTSVRGCFRHEIKCEASGLYSRKAMLKFLFASTPRSSDVSLSHIALQTAALVARDLRDLVARAGAQSIKRVASTLLEMKSPLAISRSEDDIAQAGVIVTAQDIGVAIDHARQTHADSIGAPKIPAVTWDDVGGLAHVREEILDTVQLPLQHPELFASGMKQRSGILLYGPPGTGKTLIAKAVATTLSLNFLSVKGPELLNMYIGESESNVRRVFQRARDARPCVVFFDELDSVAPKRGEKGDSGGVMDRIVSQLLAELDGMNSGKGDVFVIGATNRPDLLDPALLRPGRFDKLLYLGVSRDHDRQYQIIKALTRKFRLHPSLNLRTIANRCPFNFTGADFYALCSDAMLKAMVRKISEIDLQITSMNEDTERRKAKGVVEEDTRTRRPHPLTPQYYLENIASPVQVQVDVTEEDFLLALDELVPSVPMSELLRYERVREKFEGEQARKKREEMERKEQERSKGWVEEGTKEANGLEEADEDAFKHGTITFGEPSDDV
ncbi:AAA-domain-containing protein [Gonapodya prolifera JEL478]|uniref:Peroxisomal ATPase PEX6 n=1 Tax=Gonapodya prolifera (strain JEL478) TaxID=1344416 RepID=A0A139ADA2_GONPJ|nr:AAA-domain-containing protein [Gonapodya prolifera JEL478]|eukprot:KXS14639.1 AAA-domain-containing protein [Gonapodya prolifera JEL478]